MAAREQFTVEEARRYGREVGIDWSSAPFDVEEFRAGMNVELEHGRADPLTNVTHDDPVTTARIALAHLKEFSDYYTRLRRMELERSSRSLTETSPGRKTRSPPPPPWDTPSTSSCLAGHVII